MPGARTIRVGKHVQVRQRRRRQIRQRSRRSRRRSRPGNPRSCRIRSTRAAGARRCCRPAAGSTSSVYGRRIARSIRSLACCSGRWKCGANRPPLEATRSTIAGVQSIGSSELTRNVTSCGDVARARAAVRAASVARLQVAAVGTEVDAGQRDLLEPGRRDPRDLADDVVDRQAAARAARRRNDAVAAALLAAGLHAQRERRPAGDARLDRRAARPVAVAEPSRSSARRHPRAARRAQLVVVADDTDDAGQRRDVVRRSAWRSSR